MQKEEKRKAKEKRKIYPYERKVPKKTRRNKKHFLSNQCKEIEGNNRMGKARDLFKKMCDIKGPFHAKMGTVKDRNCMDLTEAEEIKKRWQGCTEELYKKIFMTQIITMV